MYEAVPQQPVIRPAAPRHLALGVGMDGTYTLGGQIAAFVLGLITAFVCLPLVVVAAVLYTRAEERFAARDTVGGRRLVIWSWLSITALPVPVTGTIVLTVVAIRALVG